MFYSSELMNLAQNFGIRKNDVSVYLTPKLPKVFNKQHKRDTLKVKQGATRTGADPYFLVE